MSSNLNNLNTEYQELSDTELETVVGGTGKGKTNSSSTAAATASNTNNIFITVEGRGGRRGGYNGGPRD